MPKDSGKTKDWEKHAHEKPREPIGDVTVERASVPARTPHFSATRETAEMENLEFTKAVETDFDGAPFPAEETRYAEDAAYGAVARAMKAAAAAGREAEMEVARAMAETDRSAEAGPQETEDSDECFAEE